MVKKSYRTIFKDPTGFREKVLYCIFDLDKRIKQLMRIEDLEQLFSKKNHTHDTKYSSINHNHDEQYSQIGHNHDERYSQINHTHNEYLTKLDMAEYAEYDHTHNNVMYITPFKVSGGLTYVLCEIEPNGAIVLEDTMMEHFSIEEIRGKYLILNYDGEVTNRVYHLIYYQVTTDGQQNVFMQVNNITANRGDKVTLYSTLTDINNAPVNEGEVTYTLSGGNDD